MPASWAAARDVVAWAAPSRVMVVDDAGRDAPEVPGYEEVAVEPLDWLDLDLVLRTYDRGP